jgi:signal transduction histidine kinase
MVNGLRALAERMLKGMHLTFEPSADAWLGSLSLESRRELYLMCKEALQNIVKHSSATGATIWLRLTGRAFEVVITDNGRGFDLASASSAGFGLGNLRERARRMGGTCKIESLAGKGTTVTMSVPLE